MCHLLQECGSVFQAAINHAGFPGPAHPDRLADTVGRRWDRHEGKIDPAQSQQNAVIKSVPMHPRVFEMLSPIWERRGKPTQGHVFLNRFGEPYQDTRKANIPGGNPIRTADHCRWRHDTPDDLRTLSSRGNSMRATAA
jgi:hypothetical protein